MSLGFWAVCWAHRVGPVQEVNKVEYPRRRRVHHEEEVRRAVQGNGYVRSSERGADAPGVG